MPARNRLPLLLMLLLAALVLVALVAAAAASANAWGELFSPPQRQSFSFWLAPPPDYAAALAKRLLDDIISVGNTVDAGEAFRRFRGRDVQVEALMRDRGFPSGGETREKF